MDMFLQFLVTGIMLGGVYGLIALGLVIIYKSSGVLNLAHGAFMLVMAMLAWTLADGMGLPMWLSIVAVLAVSVVLGYGVERVILRPLIGQPILATIIVTLALGFFLEGVAIMSWGGNIVSYQKFLPREPFTWGPVIIPQAYVWSFLVAIALFILLLVFFRYTKYGLAMQMVSEDHQVARSLGVNVRTVFAQTWILAVMMAAIAGILYGSLHPLSMEMTHLGLVKAIPVVLLGGMNSLAGALVGGLIIGVAEVVGAGYIDPIIGGGFKDVVPLILMLLILLIKPYGLFGWVRIERI